MALLARLFIGATNAVAVTLLLGLVAILALQIVLRDVFAAPIVGLEEVTRMLMILMVWIAYPLVVAAGENIVMAELKAAMPGRLRHGMDLLIGLACTTAAGLMVWATWEALAANPRNMTPTLRIPFWIYLAAAAFGFAAAGILHLRRLRQGQDGGSVAL
ncbi:TRAP transporter small permease [Falsiroseomonas oryzae]|uniref:TRAP transporter small permease n=1 Tax=Falsiroseomonas oryzae TaxID=2766473 RepID=UPI0022EB81BF|nr:TRAP transporter small permease subunit [Roseomonas sp. MO-31]